MIEYLDTADQLPRRTLRKTNKLLITRSIEGKLRIFHEFVCSTELLSARQFGRHCNRDQPLQILHAITRLSTLPISPTL